MLSVDSTLFKLDFDKSKSFFPFATPFHPDVALPCDEAAVGWLLSQTLIISPTKANPRRACTT